MPSLTLKLLGEFQARLDDQLIEGFRTAKVQALLVYLVVEPERQSRESLIELLWPGMPERSARHNLRQILYYLRSAIPELDSSLEDGKSKVPPLLSNRHLIRLNPKAAITSDLAQFDTLLVQVQTHEHIDLPSCQVCKGDLEAAVTLYQGEFLADFYLVDSNEFEDWAQMTRQAYRRNALDALETLTTMAILRQDYSAARELAERQLEIDNLREGSYRQLMEILALSGRREEALAVYESCRRILAEELSMQPASRTTEIYEMILAGDLSFEKPRTYGVRGYELKEEIGAGAHGAIHRAVQPAIGREVAVKVIHRKFANDPEFIRRFEDEAQIIARLEHPHVVPLYDYWRDANGTYLVMRYLRGGNLLTRLEKGPWNSEQAVMMLDQVTSALAVAHRMGIIHRDIKPANILFDESGNAYLSDFSIAKELNGDRGLTATGGVLGTPDYISPEQILDERVTPQTDLYSLAAVLYETLTGERPFGGASVANLIYKHINEALPLVSASRPDLPSEIDDVIQKATAKHPADRYANALEMAEAVRRVLIGGMKTRPVQPVMEAGIALYNPYKGLRPFQEIEADDFFGRDSLVDRLIDRLSPAKPSPNTARNGENGRFLAVVGPSGSGKSSAIKAGLIPALRLGAVPGSEKWFVVEMVPGAHPLEELESALWRVAVDAPPSLVEPMERDVRGMLRTIRRILPEEDSPNGNSQLLLIIDQFEELFTLVEDETKRDFFLDSVLAAVSAPRSPLRVIITLRADFYDRPLQYQRLGDLVKHNTEVVLPLTPEELTWAIREPARRMGVALAEGLAEAVIADVADQPGSLPLLQYALTELFERRQANMMTMEAYREIGGVHGALGRRAETLYKDLGSMEQEVTRQIFLRLVTLGEGVEDTRRRVLRSELEAIDRHSQSSADSQEAMSGVGESASSLVGGADIIDMFGTARLLTFDRDAATRSPTVEVAHEALLREWQRLRAWLEASRDDIRSQRLLARATVEWLRADKDESYLLHGARLSQYEGWARASSVVLTGDERTYLENSVASREVRQVEDKARRQRELETARALAETEQARAAAESKRAEEQAGAALRLRRLVIVLVGLLFVAAALAVLAEQERDKAEELARISRSRELAAASIISQNTNSELSLLLAIQALSTAETNEAEQALHLALLTSRVRQRLVGHETAIQRLAYSPDGRLIALYAAGEDLATIWDAASGRKLHELPVSRCCWGIYFDDAGQRLAAVEPGMNFNITLWDTDTGERFERFSLPISIFEIGGYYLHPDWSRVAIFLTDGTLAVWDIESGTQLFDLPGHSGFVELEYSKDGRRLVTYDNPDGLVIVWDALTGELLRRFETGQLINDHAVSPDGRWLALAVDAGEAGWEVHFWDVDAPQEDDVVSPSDRLAGHPDTIRLIDFSADGRMVASASRDGTSRIWDRETGELLFVLPHGAHVRSVVFHPAGHSLLTSDLNGVARVWDITPQGSSEHLGLVVNDGLVFDADISPDGQTLVTGGTAKLWDLATGTLLQTLIGHGDMVMSVAFDPDGRRVATASLDGTARVWDTATGVELYRLEAHDDESPAWTGLSGVLSVAYHPDGDRLATAGTDHTARIWDSESGEQLHVLEGHTAGLATVAFSPDGNYLATGQASGTDLNVEALPTTVRLWDTETGQGMFFFNSGHGQRVWGLAFSPDGNFLATVGTDAAVRLWALDFDAGRAELRETLTSHTNTVIGVAFSPDGRMLATATPDEVRLWDVGPLYDSSDASAIGELFVLPGGAALAFSPDGSELITAGRDGLMRAYLLDAAELLSFAQTRLTRWWTEAECRQYLHVTNCPVGISE